jgi:hypothetical protein
MLGEQILKWTRNKKNEDKKRERNRRAERVDQVIELLPSKCEALSSNHSTDKKKKRNRNI